MYVAIAASCLDFVLTLASQHESAGSLRGMSGKYLNASGLDWQGLISHTSRAVLDRLGCAITALACSK